MVEGAMNDMHEPKNMRRESGERFWVTPMLCLVVRR